MKEGVSVPLADSMLHVALASDVGVDFHFILSSPYSFFAKPIQHEQFREFSRTGLK
jgi:hypothetical protein